MRILQPVEVSRGLLHVLVLVKGVGIHRHLLVVGDEVARVHGLRSEWSVLLACLDSNAPFHQ